MPIKICFIATGDSIHSFRWINFFAERGHDTHWISLTPFLERPKHNIHYYEMPQHSSEWIQILLSWRKVLNLLNIIKPDILHIHSAGRHGVLGTLTGFHPSVVTAWGSEILIAGKSISHRPLVSYILKKTDLITCDADHMREAIVNYGVPEGKVRIIYFGTDVTKFCPKKRDEEITKELGITDRPVVISLRSLEPIYDVETLIRAIPGVLGEHPQAVFIIGGKGSQKEQLTALAGKLKIEANVRFIGEIRNDQLPKYLNLADIYVSTSLSDAGLAASTAEAMSCGLPVVVTDSGENTRWVKQGSGGFVVPVQEHTAIAEKIKYLLRDTSICGQFGKYNRGVIEVKNNYCREMEKMEEVYESLIEQYDKNKKIS